jgi:hypothetical protein
VSAATLSPSLILDERVLTTRIVVRADCTPSNSLEEGHPARVFRRVLQLLTMNLLQMASVD